MSNLTKGIESIFSDTPKDPAASTLKRMKTRFKESDGARKAKDWAFKPETKAAMREDLSDFFVGNSRTSQVDL